MLPKKMSYMAELMYTWQLKQQQQLEQQQLLHQQQQQRSPAICPSPTGTIHTTIRIWHAGPSFFIFLFPLWTFQMSFPQFCTHLPSKKMLQWPKFMSLFMFFYAITVTHTHRIKFLNVKNLHYLPKPCNAVFCYFWKKFLDLSSVQPSYVNFLLWQGKKIFDGLSSVLLNGHYLCCETFSMCSPPPPPKKNSVLLEAVYHAFSHGSVLSQLPNHTPCSCNNKYIKSFNDVLLIFLKYL